MENGKIDRVICQIRHEFTNYDRLSAFYHVQRELRTQLNRVIGLLRLDRITIEEFRSKVRDIEQRVDLTRKPNQKRYIKASRNSILATGHYTVNQANAIAKKNVGQILKLQTEINSGRRNYDSGYWDKDKKNMRS